MIKLTKFGSVTADETGLVFEGFVFDSISGNEFDLMAAVGEYITEEARKARERAEAARPINFSMTFKP